MGVYDQYNSGEIELGREELSYYGAIIADYKGQGCLTLKNGWKWDCGFEAGQLADGKALLICHIPISSVPINQRSKLNLVDLADGFKGETGDYSITATEGFRVLNKLFDTETKPVNYVVAYFMHDFNLQKRDADARRAHFGITNFELIEITPRLIPCGGSMAQGVMAFQVIDNYQPEEINLCLKDDINSITTNVSIKPLPKYSEIINRVKTLKSINATCEIVVDINNELNIDKCYKIISNLCYLLSIARGTKIHSIYCYQFDASGECISRRHVSKEPKPYCPLYTISPGIKETKDFLERSYQNFIKRLDPYKLNMVTIDAYLDAKAETDYISIRGVKLGVSLEILKDVFLQSRIDQGSPINKFIIDKEFFDKKIRPCLKKSIKGIISKIIEEKNEKDSEELTVDYSAINGKIPELNRYSFNSSLKKLFTEIEFNPNAEDIQRFLKCRNELIHTGRFYCYNIAQKEGRTCSREEILEEFFFLINFLDKIFLNLIGYKGYYSNWSEFPEVRREEIT